MARMGYSPSLDVGARALGRAGPSVIWHRSDSLPHERGSRAHIG
jgi:hypothetical protein